MAALRRPLTRADPIRIAIEPSHAAAVRPTSATLPADIPEAARDDPPAGA